MAVKKVLVTGGAGYIGVHTTVELVHAGYEPIVVDDLSRSDIRIIKGAEKILGRQLEVHQIDCGNQEKLRKVFELHPDMQSVIHFAAFKSVSESVSKPTLYYKNNIGSLITLLEVMQEFSVNRLVFSSSCTVYGQPDEIPVTEETPFKKAASPYGATKQMGERILDDVVKAQPGLRVVTLRYFNPVGAHPSGLIGELPIGVPNNLVPFITQTAIGKRDKLTIFGNDYQTPDGTCLRDYIHIIDLAQAHVRALGKIDGLPNRFEAINLGSGQPASVLELVNTFMKTTGQSLHFDFGPRRPGDVEKVYADIKKSTQLLGWKTQFSLEQAMLDAWHWEQSLNNETH